MSSRVYVDRPPPAVWTLLADIRRWPEWSPICTDCSLAPGGTLAAGAVLTMRLRVLFFSVRARVTVFSVLPCREIGWEARCLGVRARHRYSVRPRRGGSTVHNEELFEGVGLLTRPLLRRWFRATDLSRESLIGIKRVAESAAAPGEHERS